MRIFFYSKKNSNRSPVVGFIEKLQSKDRAKILACLKGVEDLGFECLRVQFRQIQGRLWEIKIRSSSAGFRIFYVSLIGNALMLLHGYKKQSQKAPKKEIDTAMQRMLEVIACEKNYA
jgi:phage-related protein